MNCVWSTSLSSMVLNTRPYCWSCVPNWVRRRRQSGDRHTILRVPEVLLLVVREQVSLEGHSGLPCDMRPTEEGIGLSRRCLKGTCTIQFNPWLAVLLGGCRTFWITA